jgi:hypothetical protein
MGLWQEKDFTKVPTRQVYGLYQTYNTLPKGEARLNFRVQHPELDAWLVYAKGYTYASDAAKSTSSKEYLAMGFPSPQQIVAGIRSIGRTIKEFIADVFAPVSGPTVSGRYTPEREMPTISSAELLKNLPSLPPVESPLQMQQIMDFLASSNVSEGQYVWDEVGSATRYVCLNFTIDLVKEAKAANLPIGQAILYWYDEKRAAHAIAWIQVGGQIYYIEPQDDRIYTRQELLEMWSSAFGGLRKIKRTAPDGTEEIEELLKTYNVPEEYRQG